MQGTYDTPFVVQGDIFYNVTFFTSSTLPFGDHTVTVTMDGGAGTGPQILVLNYFLVDTGQPSSDPPMLIRNSRLALSVYTARTGSRNPSHGRRSSETLSCSNPPHLHCLWLRN